MLDAVLRSIWPEIPSGPVAVLVLWVESRLRTLFSSQVIEERVGVSAGEMVFPGRLRLGAWKSRRKRTG